MNIVTLPASGFPHTSKLFAAYMNEYSAVQRFFAYEPSMKSVLASAREAQVSPEMRSEVVAILREQNAPSSSDASVAQSLERLARGAVAVVTGQQVGLLGGPAYSFYKALTAIRVAEELTARGCEAVPIFWLATEDHDFAEVNHVFWLGRKGHLERLQLEDAGAAGGSVGEIRLGPSVTPVVEAAAKALEGPNAEEIGAAIAQAYRPDETMGGAFRKLAARILEGRGLIILDPTDARLHRLGTQLFQHVLSDAPTLTNKLLSRNKELESAGYHAQVKVTEKSTPVFLSMDGQRVALKRRDSGFAAGKRSFSMNEALALAKDSPESFSANALLRPVFQDTLLPTAAYVGGPAEVAYFAQSQIIYEHMQVRIPPILWRAGFTLLEPGVARLLGKYKLGMSDVLDGRQQVRRKMERAFLPAELERRFAAGEKQLRGVLEKLRAPMGQLDVTLTGALDTAGRKMLYQFLRLREKSGRARNFREGVLERHEQLLMDALYPNRGLQERSLSLLPFLARKGLGLLDELAARALPDKEHRVLFL